MAPVRRSLRLRSNEIIDQLQNYDDSDIEEAQDEEMEDLIQIMQDTVADQEETMEEIAQPVIERGRSRTRVTRRARASRGRRGGRSGRGSRSAARSRPLVTAREIDELNGWSYIPQEVQPENHVFQEQSAVMASIDEKSSEFDCFSIFFPETFWKLVKTETNHYASQMKAKQTRQGLLKPGSMLYNWKPVTIQELKKFFSIIIHMTLVRKESFDAYWSTREIIETPYAEKLMQRSRFRAIYSCIHLNDHSNYIPCGQDGYDAFFKLRPYFDELSELCKNSYYPKEALTIDEGTCGFRGRIHFRVYNKDKPNKYGMKVYMICEAETGYILKKFYLSMSHLF